MGVEGLKPHSVAMSGSVGCAHNTRNRPRPSQLIHTAIVRSLTHQLMKQMGPKCSIASPAEMGESKAKLLAMSHQEQLTCGEISCFADYIYGMFWETFSTVFRSMWCQRTNQNLDDMFMKKLTHLSLCQIFQRLHADPGLPVESSAPGFAWRLSHHGCHAHQLGELLKA